MKPYTTLYEDDDIIAVNKTSGIAVTGERWDEDAPRLDLLLREISPSDVRGEIYTVHRIDKETSGLVIFAKNRETHKQLSAAFESRLVEKTYTAVVHGRPSWPDGLALCDLPLTPDGNKKHLTVIDKFRGKPSLTRFTLKLSAGNYSLVEARPETGRTHQIRVHLASLGHPVVCDHLYGKHSRSGAEKGVYLSSFKRNWRGDAFEERPLLARLGLHAARLVVQRPGGSLALEAPLSRDMAALINQMEKCGT
ncbi:RNA pseudouridine synthase [Spirochaetia bacterium]|nr:RNA pseudouridine synthase [Spirochaetia bacterium]